MNDRVNVQTNVRQVEARITAAEKTYGRNPGSVQLIAVSKFHSVSAIEQAIGAGLHTFGESYLQEALEKMQALQHKSLEWHFIGALQSNKTREAAERFAWIHSVAKWKTAQRLSRQRPPNLPPLNICIQVNLSGERSKSGVTEAQTLALAQAVANLPNLRLRGLMCIPAASEDFQLQRLACRRLRELKQALQTQGIPLDTLSMGMSSDLEAAIAEGATHVRVGTAIFGARHRKPLDTFS